MSLRCNDTGPRLALLVALVLLPIPAPVDALHCNGEIITISLGSEAIYLDDRSDRLGELNHWMYLESNGIAGLQSGGDAAIFEDNGPPLGDIPPFTDGCAHPNPDAIIF